MEKGHLERLQVLPNQKVQNPSSRKCVSKIVQGNSSQLLANDMPFANCTCNFGYSAFFCYSSLEKTNFSQDHVGRLIILPNPFSMFIVFSPTCALWKKGLEDLSRYQSQNEPLIMKALLLSAYNSLFRSPSLSVSRSPNPNDA
ncbi:hypothetical protein NC653_007896 [Populus alba x Populus x berolinensis]|uniref:Uncharacterized protein n=1 Tax=Populus alba x Populus x berolinensis TaxID=444605 RepID=A0AAD6W7Z1_9ROSI|nr:hypothetical protein NC653_007896 [Populus alba x Populus x berolinensis]